MNRYGALRTVAKYALILAAVVTAQGILTLKFRVFGYFDLPLIYTVYYGFTLAKPIGSIAMGSAVGLMQDSLSGAALGTNGFTKTLIGFLAASAGAKFDVEQTVTRVFALISFTWVDLFFKGLLGLLAGSVAGGFFGSSTDVWLLSPVFNASLGLILFGYRSRFGHATA